MQLTAGDDDAIATLEQGTGGGQAELVDFFVNSGFLFDINVARGNVSFRLVIIVIAYEILDRIVRKESLKFVIQLRRQSLIMRQHQSRPSGYSE